MGYKKIQNLVEQNELITKNNVLDILKSYGKDYISLQTDVYHYLSENYSEIDENKMFLKNEECLVSVYFEYLSDIIDENVETLNKTERINKNFVLEMCNSKCFFDSVTDTIEEIDVYDGICHQWVDYNDDRMKPIRAKISEFENAIDNCIIKTKISDKLTEKVLNKQEIYNNICKLQNETKKETTEETYRKTLEENEEYHRLNDMYESAKNYIKSCIINIRFMEEYKKFPLNKDKFAMTRTELFYHHNLTKDEMLQYVLKPVFGWSSAESFAKDIYGYMWEFKPDQDKMNRFTYALMDIAKYEYNKVVMDLEYISALDNKKAFKLARCKSNIDDIVAYLGKSYSDYRDEYESDEELSEYIFNLEMDIKHKFENAYERKIKLIYPHTIKIYEKVYDEITLGGNCKEHKDKMEHYHNAENLKKEIYDFIRKEGQKEIE